MGVHRLKDLNLIYKSDRGAEFKSPGGTRYYFCRLRRAVGREIAVKEYDWFPIDKNDLTTAKRKIMELINEDEV
ncbi:hypothetical protein HVE01_30420 [Vreelandella venusta]|nr:hypothetical protein HVE01_30420 [Halomonas venusta]